MKSIIFLFICALSLNLQGVLVNPVIVNSTLDLPAAAANVSPESTSSGLITLRSAIEYSQGTESAAVTTILFDIPRSAPNNYRPDTDSWLIEPTIVAGSTAAYRITTKPVIINGYTFDGAQFNNAQPNTNDFDQGTNATPKIEIRGPGVSLTMIRGFRVINGIQGCQFRGLIINRFLGVPGASGSAIRLDAGAHNTVIAGNFFSVDVTGQFADEPDTGIALDNARAVQTISSNNLQIGGPNPEDSNLASSVVADVITFNTAIDSLIQRNYVGVNRTGDRALRQFSAISGIRLDIAGNVSGQNNRAISNQVCGIQTAFLIEDLNALIQDNIIGTNLQGNQAIGNNLGIELFPERLSNLRTTLINNLISGNEVGISILPGIGIGQDIRISDCKVGTDLSGTKPLPNTTQGIWVNGCNNTVIDSSIVSANGGNGIFISELSTNTSVLGNQIGEGADYNKLGNKFNGVQIGVNGQDPFEHAAIIGTLDQPNRINANLENGVAIVGNSFGNTIQGNTIGDRNLGNQKDGVLITTGTNNEILDNSIQYNQRYGIELTDDAVQNIIQRNTIKHNKKGGIIIRDSSDNLIGADDEPNCGSLENGNVIKFNGGDGVKILEVSGGAHNNAILANSIFDNDDEAISLDSSESENPNDLLPAPILTSAKNRRGETIVTGKLKNSFSDTDFVIEFFAISKNERGGDEFVGRIEVRADRHGDASFTVTLDCDVKSGLYITATATELNANNPANTSEFSNAIRVK